MRRSQHQQAGGMNRQSEWLVLRRVYAFLKSRNLKEAAYALEKEARLKFDTLHLYDLFVDGEWRRADEYVTAFMRYKECTPDGSGTLFPIRLQCLVGALRQGDRPWALRYHSRNVLPLLVKHPDRAAVGAQLVEALHAAAEGRLDEAFPDDIAHRRRCFVDFLRYADENKHLYRCTLDPMDLNLKFMARTGSLTMRRYTTRRRRRPMSRRQGSRQLAAAST